MTNPRLMFPILLMLLACRTETALIKLSPSALPDLTVSYSTYYNPQECGVQGYIDSVTVSNQGAADAGTFVVEINGVKMPEVPGLAVGETITFSLVELKLALDVRVMADVENSVPETDETNNYGQWSSMTSTFLIPCPTPT
jgi:subtilase family serine protease